jgi:hypothetical protein
VKVVVLTLTFKARNDSMTSKWNAIMFRFSIREMVLATVVITLGASWVVEQRKLHIALKEVKHQREEFIAIRDQLSDFELAIGYEGSTFRPLVYRSSP